MRTAKGITLLEMVLVAAILGVLLAITFVSLPSDHTPVNQAARGFAEQFPRARLEALRADAFAGIFVSTSGSGGYAVCVDQNDNQQCDSGEAVQTVAMGGGSFPKVHIVGSSTTVAKFLFDPRGIPFAATGGNVVFSNPSGNYTVTVNVTAAGKATVQ